MPQKNKTNKKPNRTKNLDRLPESDNNLITKGIRIPRERGYTHTLSHIHYLKDPQQKTRKLERFKKLIIENWILASYHYNNILTSIDELSILLNYKRRKLIRIHNEISIEISKRYDDQAGGISNLARVLIFQAYKKILKASSEAELQSQLLVSQQDGQYVPFLSAAANQAITNTLNSTKPMLELIKMIQPTNPSGTHIHNHIPASGNTQNNLYITQEKALLMIRENTTSPLEDEARLGTLLDPALAASLPNIDARTQDLSMIGIKGSAEEAPNKKAKSGQLAHGKRPHIIDLDEDELGEFRV